VLYTDIHAHPELSMQETRTAGLAAERMRTAGFDVSTGVGKTGVVGLRRRGAAPTVMLRADMDALPVAEATGLPYASTATGTDREGNTVPVMHACGHDMHVTWLVDVATRKCSGGGPGRARSFLTSRTILCSIASTGPSLASSGRPRALPPNHPPLRAGPFST
jgi:hypothetical protein